MHTTQLKSKPAQRSKAGRMLAMLGIIVMGAQFFPPRGLMVAWFGALMLGMGLAVSLRAKMRDRRAHRRARQGAGPGNLPVGGGQNQADCNETSAYPRPARRKLVPTA